MHHFNLFLKVCNPVKNSTQWDLYAREEHMDIVVIHISSSTFNNFRRQDCFVKQVSRTRLVTCVCSALVSSMGDFLYLLSCPYLSTRIYGETSCKIILLDSIRWWHQIAFAIWKSNMFKTKTISYEGVHMVWPNHRSFLRHATSKSGSWSPIRSFIFYVIASFLVITCLQVIHISRQ